MKVAQKNMLALCPECEGAVDVGPKPGIGQKLICSHCNTDLEITGLSPLALDWDMDDFDGDDWGDDDDNDWDDDDDDDWDDDEDDDWDDDEASEEGSED